MSPPSLRQRLLACLVPLADRVFPHVTLPPASPEPFLGFMVFWEDPPRPRGLHARVELPDGRVVAILPAPLAFPERRVRLSLTSHPVVSAPWSARLLARLILWLH